MEQKPISDVVLAHHGVKGMKWGVRKDGKPQGFLYGARGKRNARNPNYSEKQRRRDEGIYGRRGVKRINRRLNQGDSITTARGSEVSRRNRVAKKSRRVRTTGGVVGGLAGMASVPAVSAYYKSGMFHKNTFTVLEKLFGNSNPKVQGGVKAAARLADISLYTLTNSPAAKTLVTLGATTLGSQVGRDAATSAYIKSKGYDPERVYR